MLVYAESCGDIYNTATSSEWIPNLSGAFSVISGRTNNAIQNNAATTQINIPYSPRGGGQGPSVWYGVLGFALWINNGTLSGAGGPSFVRFTTGGMQLQINSPGQLDFRVGNISLFPRVSGAIAFGTWNYIEIKFSYFFHFSGSSVSSTDCYADVRLNTVSLTGGLQGPVNTSVNNSHISKISLGDPGTVYNAGSFRIDDIYLLDCWTGDTVNTPYCNDFLGDIRVVPQLATGTGSVTQWTSNGASPNYNCINNNPPDDDTTYVSSSGGTTDTYAVGSCGLTNVVGVTVGGDIKSTKSAAASVNLGIGNGSGAYNWGNYMTQVVLGGTLNTINFTPTWSPGTSYSGVSNQSTQTAGPSTGSPSTFNNTGVQVNTQSCFSFNPFTNAAWLASDIANIQLALRT